MRRLLLTLSTVGAFALLAQPASAQFTFGAQGAVMTGIDDLSTITPTAPDLSGTFGIGARALLSPPLLPVGLIAQGTYYMPDVGSRLQYGVAGQLKIPLPVIQPYALGGWQWRRVDDNSGGGTVTETGPMVGVGVQVNLGVSLFLEATGEFADEIPTAPTLDVSPIVIKGGIIFG